MLINILIPVVNPSIFSKTMLQTYVTSRQNGLEEGKLCVLYSAMRFLLLLINILCATVQHAMKKNKS